MILRSGALFSHTVSFDVTTHADTASAALELVIDLHDEPASRVTLVAYVKHAVATIVGRGLKTPARAGARGHREGLSIHIKATPPRDGLGDDGGLIGDAPSGSAPDESRGAAIGVGPHDRYGVGLRGAFGVGGTVSAGRHGCLAFVVARAPARRSSDGM